MEFDITQREYRDEPGDRGSMTNYYAGSDSQGQLFQGERIQAHYIQILNWRTKIPIHKLGYLKRVRIQGSKSIFIGRRYEFIHGRLVFQATRSPNSFIDIVRIYVCRSYLFGKMNEYLSRNLRLGAGNQDNIETVLMIQFMVTHFSFLFKKLMT